jgi:hypothetical protein
MHRHLTYPSRPVWCPWKQLGELFAHYNHLSGFPHIRILTMRRSESLPTCLGLTMTRCSLFIIPPLNFFVLAKSIPIRSGSLLASKDFHELYGITYQPRYLLPSHLPRRHLHEFHFQYLSVALCHPPTSLLPWMAWGLTVVKVGEWKPAQRRWRKYLHLITKPVKPAPSARTFHAIPEAMTQNV